MNPPSHVRGLVAIYLTCFAFIAGSWWMMFQTNKAVMDLNGRVLDKNAELILRNAELEGEAARLRARLGSRTIATWGDRPIEVVPAIPKRWEE